MTIPALLPGAPSLLSIGAPCGDGLGLGNGPGFDAPLDLERPPQPGDRIGGIPLAPASFDTIRVVGVLEEAPDLAAWLRALTLLLKDGGTLEATHRHWLAPDVWAGDDVPRRLSPFAWRSWETAADILGLPDCRLVVEGLDGGFSELGQQMHANHGVPVESLLHEPRAMNQVTVKLRKRGGYAVGSAAPKDPVASVVLPVYRRTGLAERSIDAVLGQSLDAVEVFIVGDACPVHCRRMADPFFLARVEAARRRGMTVHVLNLDQNHGTPHGAINFALRAARGNYFAWMGDDDYWLPHHLEQRVGAAEQGAWDMVLFRSRLVGDYFDTVRIPRLEVNHVGHSEVLVRTEAARRAPEHVPHNAQDFLFVRDLSERGPVGVALGLEPTFLVNLCRRERYFDAAKTL